MSSSRTTRRLLGSLAVFAGVALLWGVLFVAFGTADGLDDSGDTNSVDHFDRPDSATELGSTKGGPAWTVAGGTWGIVDGRAAVTSDSAGAVLTAGGSDVTVSARMAAGAPGWALLFRYADAQDQWFVSTPSAGGPLTAYVVTKGKIAEVATGTGAAPKAGDTIEVHSTPKAIRVKVGDRTVMTIADARLAHATMVGMALLGADRDARWDDFSVDARGAPIVTVPAGSGS